MNDILDEWLDVFRDHPELKEKLSGLSAEARQMASSDGHQMGSNSWWDAMKAYRYLLVEEIVENYL